MIYRHNKTSLIIILPDGYRQGKVSGTAIFLKALKLIYFYVDHVPCCNASRKDVFFQCAFFLDFALTCTHAHSIAGELQVNNLHACMYAN